MFCSEPISASHGALMKTFRDVKLSFGHIVPSMQADQLMSLSLFALNALVPEQSNHCKAPPFLGQEASLNSKSPG